MDRSVFKALGFSRQSYGLLAGVLLHSMGAIDEALLRAMPKGVRAGNGNRYTARSRHRPHQGPREIARRARQIAAGTLEVSRG